MCVTYGIAATATSYGATIRAPRKTGTWEQFPALYRDMTEGTIPEAGVDGAGGVRSDGSRLMPEVITFMTLLTALGQNNRSVDARGI